MDGELDSAVSPPKSLCGSQLGMLQPLKPPEMDSWTPTPQRGVLEGAFGEIEGGPSVLPGGTLGTKIFVWVGFESNEVYTIFEVLYLGFLMSHV